MKLFKLTLFALSSLITLTTTQAFATESIFESIKDEIEMVETKLHGRIGVAILDTEDNAIWGYKGNERFPITSTFKTLACAKLLNDVDKGSIKLSDSVIVLREILQEYSPVTKDYLKNKITLKESCAATMHTSDNTAANIILDAIGGPSELTKFIGSIGDNVTRLDRPEPELNEGKPGDERDTTSPIAMTKTINELLYGKTLSVSNQLQLKEWMVNNQVTGNLLRSILPTGWKIADRSGAGGYGSRSITAVIWSESHAPKIISIYIADTKASFEQRNDAIVRIGKVILNNYALQKEG